MNKILHRNNTHNVVGEKYQNMRSHVKQGFAVRRRILIYVSVHCIQIIPILTLWQFVVQNKATMSC